MDQRGCSANDAYAAREESVIPYITLSSFFHHLAQKIAKTCAFVRATRVPNWLEAPIRLSKSRQTPYPGTTAWVVHHASQA
jgi:hypothetical protein